MPTEDRIRGLEARTSRNEDDINALITTVVETRDDVRWLKDAVQLLLEDRGITPPAPNDEQES